LLGEYGNRLQSCYIKHLEKGVWELRPEYGGSEFRFFYVLILGEKIYILHAIRKKRQKTLRRDIEIALKRAQEIETNDHD